MMVQPEPQINIPDERDFELRVIQPDLWWSREGLLDPGKAAIASGQSCVYWFYGIAGLLYVGSTRNPYRRWMQHANNKPWWHEVWRIEQLVTPSAGVALQIEDDAIRFQQPLYNRTGPWALRRKAMQRRGFDAVFAEVADGFGLPA